MSHITALRCFRHLGAEVVARLERMRLADLDTPPCSTAEALETYLSFAISVGMSPSTPHLLKASGNAPWDGNRVVTHFASDERAAILVKLSDAVYASAPEYLVRQLASLGDVVDLAQLIFELCGVYAHPSNERIELKDRASFTSKRSLEKYLAQHRPFRGASRFERALKLSKDRSASHMETACAILLGFPYALGGLNFPVFEMNGMIEIPKNMRSTLGRSRCYGDLLWRGKRVILEYESNMVHANSSKIAADSARRNALQKADYQVVTLTGNQMYDSGEFWRTARVLADALGHRVQPRCKDYRRKYYQLRWAVLNDQAFVFREACSAVQAFA